MLLEIYLDFLSYNSPFSVNITTYAKHIPTLCAATVLGSSHLQSVH